jgi:protein involved in polysaccharide export with SLBB domain
MGCCSTRCLQGGIEKITGASDFGQLLSAAAGVTAAPDAAAAAVRYDGASLRAAEEQRDREQQAIIPELRRRYVDGPVLIVPRAGSGSINTMGATVIPGAGTVFRAMANKGAWGLLRRQGRRARLG